MFHLFSMLIAKSMPETARKGKEGYLGAVSHFHGFNFSLRSIKAMPEPTVEGEDVEPRLKLECVASWRLFGWVQVGPLISHLLAAYLN